MTLRFSEIPDAVLAPLAGHGDAVWNAAPEGAWSPGEIVAHLATATGNSLAAFRARAEQPAMTRRSAPPKVVVARMIVLGAGWIPGRIKAPETALPPANPGREATAEQLRAAVAGFLELERTLLPRRAGDLFVKHPRLGDLNLPEWLRFHVVHTTHHLRQIRDRVALAVARLPRGAGAL